MKKIFMPLVAVLIAFACEREELLDSSVLNVQPEGEHVYIFGKKATGVSSTPYTLLCWKDNVQISIDQAPAGRAPYLRKAVSDESGVYLVGCNADPLVGGNTGRMACYWKNGVLKTLTAAEGSFVHGACVSSGKLYIFGNDGSANCIWVNDTKYTFSFTPGFYQPIDIAVTSTSIILVGTKNYPNQLLGYWKIPLPLGDSATPLSGTYIDLNGADTASGAYNAYTMNDELIIAGYRNYGSAYYPTVWRNDTPAIVGNSSTGIITVMYVFGEASSPSYLMSQGVTAGASASETVLSRGGTVLPVPFPTGYTANQSWSGAAATSDGFIIVGYSEASAGTPYIARYWHNDTTASTMLNDSGDTVNSFQVNAVTAGKGW